MKRPLIFALFFATTMSSGAMNDSCATASDRLRLAQHHDLATLDLSTSDKVRTTYGEIKSATEAEVRGMSDAELKQNLQEWINARVAKEGNLPGETAEKIRTVEALGQNVETNIRNIL